MNFILSVVSALFLANVAFSQKSASPKIEVDLLSGESKESKLPAGWDISDSNCILKFDGGTIYFERQSAKEKCSFVFTKENMPNGIYSLKTDFEIDGNNREILLGGKSLKKQKTVKVIDGKLRVGIQTKGGKAWGWIRKMIFSRVQSK